MSLEVACQQVRSLLFSSSLHEVFRGIPGMRSRAIMVACMHAPWARVPYLAIVILKMYFLLFFVLLANCNLVPKVS